MYFNYRTNIALCYSQYYRVKINPHHVESVVLRAEPRLQTTVRQVGLESSIWHTQGWLKLILFHITMMSKQISQQKRN